MRFKKWENAKKELNGVRDLGVDHIFLADETFIPEKYYKGSEHLLDGLDSVTFGFFSRADVICNTSRRYLQDLKDRGVQFTYIGAESGSQKALELIDKRISKEQIEESTKKLSEMGFCVGTFWILGYPGTTEEDDQETLDFIEYLYKKGFHHDAFPHPYISFKGTPSSLDPGLRLLDHDLETWGMSGKEVQAHHELVDPTTAKVIYSNAEIQQMCKRAAALTLKYGRYKYGGD